MSRPGLFSPLELRGVKLKNRIVISPMSQYKAVDGLAQDWHLVHLGQFALGGAGLVFCEATSVEMRGRSTNGELCIWSKAQAEAFKPVTRFIKAQGAVPGIQLQHAGRKGSVRKPMAGRGPLTAADAASGNPPFATVGPSAEAFDVDWPVPQELSRDDIRVVCRAFAEGARNAALAGFEALELHAAHGYLLHSFLSPLSNHRTDEYGGDRAGRSRFVLELVDEVRRAWPAEFPLFIRMNAVDLEAGGWSIEDSVALSRELVALGMDVIDCSSGGATGASPRDVTPAGLGFRAPIAAHIRREADVKTLTHGLIIHPHQADRLISDGIVDLVAIARAALYDPYWPRHAAHVLGDRADFSDWPPEYGWWLARRDSELQTLGEDQLAGFVADTKSILKP
jgi:2,4-dienoyl-CoA reductase-like NADH-dependent reductase (Old Yellow Enzyme family)